MCKHMLAKIIKFCADVVQCGCIKQSKVLILKKIVIFLLINVCEIYLMKRLFIGFIQDILLQIFGV